MTTCSLWNAGPDAAPALRTADFTSSTEPYDVAVVGAGITGITTAMRLHERGLRVVVLEARGLGAGVTGRTSAHLTAAVDSRYTSIRKRFGVGAARLVARGHMEAIATIESYANTLGIACDFARIPAYFYAESESDLRTLHEEYEASQEAGLRVTMSRECPLPFPVAAAVAYADQARFEPLAYLVGLARKLAADGVPVYGGVRVQRAEGEDPVRLVTDRGELRATRVVYATDASPDRIAFHTTVHAYRSYVIAFEADRLPDDALFFDTMEPYHYTRLAKKDGTTWVVVGGEDHRTGGKEDTEACFERLRAYVRDRFAAHTPTHAWSAQVEEPVDGLPFVGPDPGSPSVFVATGYSGNGLTFGTLSALVLADLLTGKENAYAKLFDSRRGVGVKSAFDYVVENAPVPVHYLTDRLHRGRGTAEDLAPGQGALVRGASGKVAAYRDTDGTLHAYSPVCTHLGCHVAWNAAERSWDCPCHGSRFDAVTGQVLHGPATQGLAPARNDR